MQGACTRLCPRRAYWNAPLLTLWTLSQGSIFTKRRNNYLCGLLENVLLNSSQNLVTTCSVKAFAGMVSIEDSSANWFHYNCSMKMREFTDGSRDNAFPVPRIFFYFSISWTHESSEMPRNL